VCPKNAKVHYNIAKLSNDSDISIKHYTKAMDLWPSYEHAMNNLGNIYKNNGEFEKAEILFLKVPFIYYVSTCMVQNFI
jgi:tetratricopeptide (TPR) repeat protein